MYRINQVGQVGPSVFAILAIAAPLAFAQETVAVGKKGEVEFTTDARVGSTVLKPGHYQFQHQAVDGQHYLVVRSRSTVKSPRTRHYAGAVGDEVARVPCRLVDNLRAAKIRDTALHVKTEADGTRTVTRIDIRGEKEGHIVTLEPQS